MFRVLMTVVLLMLSGTTIAATDLASAPDQIRPILLGSKMPDAHLMTLT